MKPEIAKKWAKIFQAISEGKEIEWQMQNEEWEIMDPRNYCDILLSNPEWYRIKLEPEYIPFEYTDFKDFMLKEVRRKGEIYKGESYEITGCFKTGVFVNDGKYELGKQFDSMFEEWEFSDGKPFGKLKQ